MYYIYRDKYNKEINSLNTENKKKLDYKKLRLTDDCQYPSEEEETKTDMNKFSKYIAEEETDINDELFKKHFNFQRPSSMVKDLYKTNHGEKNSKLVSVINSGLKDFKEMSKEEREIEKPNEIVEIVKEILNFNKQNQQGQGLKILTPSQILTRLPISLAQLKAGNNSE